MAGNNTTVFPDIPANNSGYPGGPSCMIPMGPPEENIYLKINKYLWLIGPPIITVTGVIGNTLTVLILLRQLRRWSSTAVFLFVLAISDTMQLLNSPVRNWIMTGLEKHDVRHLSELGCRFSKFFTYAAVHFSSWVLVAVTVERFVSVFWPHRVREGCTRRTASVAAIILLVAVIALNSHFFFAQGVSDLPQYYGKGLCEPLYESYLEFWHKIWPWIDFAVAFAVPFLILLVCNCMIIYKLQKTQVKIRKMSIIESSGEKAYARDKRNVSVTLVVLSIVFMICLTPQQVFLIVAPYTRKETETLQCTDFLEFYRLYTIDRMSLTIVTIVSYINAGFNFILYVLSGNRFRSEVKALLLCRKTGRKGVFGNSTSSNSSRRRLTQISSRDEKGQNIHKSASDTSITDQSFTSELTVNNGSSLKTNTSPTNNGTITNGLTRRDQSETKNGTNKPKELSGIHVNL